MYDPTHLPLPTTLWGRIRYFHETVRRLVQLDASGYFARQRIETELRATTGRKAAIVLRVVPLHSLRYRLAMRALVDIVRIEISFTSRFRRSHSRRRSTQHVRQIQSDTRTLEFLVPNAPRVAVIVPVYNNWSLTADCLRSLMMTSCSTPYRLVVVDDGSSDETAERLKEIPGITIAGDGTNHGFLRAVHAGVAATSEEFVVLLNNDTIVTDGWLDALVATAESDTTVGIVGSMLLYPDGILQEAGSLIFSDGRGINYGKGDIPARAWYQFPREVDYCSGASLLIRRQTWDATGGFDLDFAPAYYEETDLAFAARRAGYRVLYQPKSVVFHLEGESYGREENPQRTALLERNKARLLEKWGAEISQHAPPAVKNRAGAAWRSPRGRILVVDTNVPETDKDSGSIRMFEVVRVLRNLGYAVTFMSLKQPPTEPYASQMRELEVEVLDGRLNYVEEVNRLAPFLRVAIFSRPIVGEVMEPVVRKLAPSAKIIYDTVDLHYIREARRAELENSPEVKAEAERFEEIELGLVRRCDATLVVTGVEQRILEAAVPEAIIREVSNVHSPIPRHGSFDERRDILFVGNFNHLPNRDAVWWFVREIFPTVHEALPGVTFKIVGSHMPPDIASIASDGVEPVGWVHDLVPLYHTVRVVVAPLRYGAGIKGKLGESAAHGVPFVCTSIATEGTLMLHERDCLNADSAEDFATEVIRLYSDASLWETLSVNVQSAIERQCSPDVAAERFRELFSLLNVW